jgi:hypothetical protein
MGSNQNRLGKRGREGKARNWKFWILFVAVPIVVIVGSSMVAYIFLKDRSPMKQVAEQGLLYAKLNRHTDAIA